MLSNTDIRKKIFTELIEQQYFPHFPIRDYFLIEIEKLLSTEEKIDFLKDIFRFGVYNTHVQEKKIFLRRYLEIMKISSRQLSLILKEIKESNFFDDSRCATQKRFVRPLIEDLLSSTTQAIFPLGEMKNATDAKIPALELDQDLVAPPLVVSSIPEIESKKTDINRAPQSVSLLSSTSMISSSLNKEPTHKRKADAVNDPRPTKRKKLSDDESSIDKQIPDSPPKPKFNFDEVVNSLRMAIHEARQGNNAQTNCGYLVEYTIESLQRLIAGKKPENRKVSTQSTANTKITPHEVKHMPVRIKIEGEEEESAVYENRVYASSAVRTRKGPHSHFPLPSTTRIDVTATGAAKVSSVVDVENKDKTIPRNPIISHKISEVLRNAAAHEPRRILIGDITMAYMDGVSGGHTIAFLATPEKVVFIDGHLNDGIKEDGDPIFTDIVETYRKADGQPIFQPTCFYLERDLLENPEVATEMEEENTYSSSSSAATTTSSTASLRKLS